MDEKKRVNITILMLGICAMQVCAASDATDEEILGVCNRENPSGTAAGWSKVVRKHDKNDLCCVKENLPVECVTHYNRTHFLIFC